MLCLSQQEDIDVLIATGHVSTCITIKVHNIYILNDFCQVLWNYFVTFDFRNLADDPILNPLFVDPLIHY